MVAGFWYNQDGLPLQYGTQKQLPEMGGDYLVYGEYREIEQYIPLVPTTWGNNSQFTVQPPPTSLTFVGTGTPYQAGIQSLTTEFPLQITAPQTASGSALTFNTTQLFIEKVELETIQTIAPSGNTMTVGLVLTNPGSPNSTFVQATPAPASPGGHLIGGATPLTLSSTILVVGTRTEFNVANVTGTVFGGGVPTATTGVGGTFLGNTPLITNAIVPLPQSAWISTLTSGAFTSGLLKIRVKYWIYGNISY